ncbi:MAG: DDE-type integrase/transposase/recombinase [bacterium]|nr:DDE-type integrase/transposase/recombinase [bacterium]
MFSKSSPQRSYSVGEREEALALAQEIGVSATSKRLNIPLHTIYTWRKKFQPADGLDQRTAEVTAGPSPETRDVAVEVESVPPSPSESEPDASSARKPAGGRVAKVYTPSLRAQILEFAAQESVTAAAIKYGLSRFSIYEWRRRVKLHADGKATDSPVVGSDDNVAAARDHRILSVWKAHPGLGPSQVRNQLRRQGFKVSVHTVRCVLEENGYVTPKVRRKDVHDQRYEAVRPNHLWHLDFLHRHIHKQKVYVLLIIDDFSRFIVGGALWDGERVAAVQETFLSAANRHGRPEKALSDGGSAFYSWKGVGAFTRLLDELEVDQLIATIPETNGKLEVLNANIQKELFDKVTFFDLGEAQHRLAAWISFYNFRRTHHALGGLLVPADRYFGRADEVLACIEAGHSPDGIGEPLSPGERHLDLFRITSHRGRIEIHLLGQRISVPLSKERE